MATVVVPVATVRGPLLATAVVGPPWPLREVPVAAAGGPP